MGWAGQEQPSPGSPALLFPWGVDNTVQPVPSVASGVLDPDSLCDVLDPAK